MAIKGSLKEAGLSDVCQLLAMGLKTGCLSVTDRSRFGQIYFDRGRITFATIVNRRDRLGDLLVREGVITHEQLETAIELQGKQPDRRLGELLLEAGFLDADTLTAHIQRQIEEAIYYLFTWKRGNFYFEVGKTPDAGEVLIAVNPETLLLEGARRVDEWSVIEKKVPSLDLIYALDRPRLATAGVDLTPEQEAIAELLDGQRSVEEVAQEAGLGEFETGKALYGLIQAGFAQRVGRAETDPADDVDVDEARNLGIAFYRTAMLEDADREFHRVIEQRPHDVVSRHYLALIALHQGDAGEAVRRLTALLESSGPRVGVFLNLAYALRRQRRYDDALRVLRQARQMAADDARVRLAEAATLLFSGDATAAQPVLDEYAAMLGQEALPPATYYYCAALAALATGREAAAGSLVEEGMGMHPAAAPLHLLEGLLAERRGALPEAERSYQQAAEEDPSLAQAHSSLGDLAHRRGATVEALEHYRRAMETEPALGDGIYTRMAEIHYRRNEREEAVRCWQRALELNPDNQIARDHLDVLARAGA